MTDKIEWKCLYQQEPIEQDIYFKFVCFYNAMTELQDRRWTDERSPYDKTEAFFGHSNRYKGYSNSYAKRLYDCIREYIWHKTKIPFDIERWDRQKKARYSAQGWIDMFEYFIKEKDEIILDMRENIWDYGRIKIEKEKDNTKTVIIRNPFLKEIE